jgi:hypothetical protein
MTADCSLRAAACCECGGATDRRSVVALPTTGKSGSVAMVYDPGTACAECMPVYPLTPEPACSNGHCQLNRLK